MSVLVVVPLTWASAAQAQMPGIPASLTGSCNVEQVTDLNPSTSQTVNVPGETVRFCNDGVPPTGGETANAPPNNQTTDQFGVDAVRVPAKYLPMRDGFGLPAIAPDAASMPGADSQGYVALDVDITTPTTTPPPGGFPLLVFMHGCCGGAPGIIGGDKGDWETASGSASISGHEGSPGYQEQWHYNNAWFASRGYVVINYTARGFVNSQSDGSTGDTQLDSRDFEIHDFQYLACEVAAARDANGNSFFHVDPSRVVATGGSYGGGFSWLAVTNPIWTCPDGSPTMKLVAATPNWGWSDLVNSLVPTGRHSTDPAQLPAFDGSDSSVPPGIPRSSVVGALFQNGISGDFGGSGSGHTTFPTYVKDAFSCLNSQDPLETNPQCKATFAEVLPSFVYEHSAYYQNQWFQKLRTDPAYRVPVFMAQGLSDPLFPEGEGLQMANRILSEVPGYPIEQYYGDFMHFVQNKARTWADMCGADDHECDYADYNGDLNALPSDLVREGINTRLTQFIDHYAQPPGDASRPQPPFNVTADLQVCPQNASREGVPGNQPGQAITAPSFGALAPNELDLNLTGTQTTTSGADDPHASSDDPIALFLANVPLGLYSPYSGSTAGTSLCAADSTPAGQGVATYDSQPLTSNATMIGATKVSIDYSAIGAQGTQGEYQLDTRLYDVLPDGTAILVDRGARRVTAPSGTVSYELNGNAWRFFKGDVIRVEVEQDALPTYRPSDVPSQTTLTAVRLAIPVVSGAGRPRAAASAAAAGATSVGPLSFSAPVKVASGEGIEAVSCPSGSLCVAGDDAGNVLTSSAPTGGQAWRAASVDPGYPIESMSCPTTALCVAGDLGGNVLTSTSPDGGAGAWKLIHVDSAVTTPDNVGFPYLDGLSCPSTKLCVAVDAMGNILTSTDPTGGGGAWKSAAVDSNGILRVSCLSTSLCVAVDDAGNVLSSTNPAGGAGAWTSNPVDGPAILSGISCPATSLCVAVDDTGKVLTSTDPGSPTPVWSQASVDSKANNIPYGISCPSVNLCVAIDDAGNALASDHPTGGAGAWKLASIDHNNLQGVSCATERLCVAVDSRGQVIAPPAASLQCPAGSTFDPARLLCVALSGTGKVFLGPTGSGIRVIALSLARKLFPHNPCVRGPGSNLVIVGTNGGNRIDLHTRSRYRIIGLGGRDRIAVWGGKGCISEGSGSDRVFVFSGQASVFAGNGRDRIYAGNGNMQIHTGNGNDRILTGNGNDVIHAGNGRDRIYTGRGRDAVYTGRGPARVYAPGDHSRVRCGSSRDIVLVRGDSAGFAREHGCRRVRVLTRR